MSVFRVASSFLSAERFSIRQGSNYNRDYSANRWAQVLCDSVWSSRRMVSSFKREKRGCERSSLAPENHWSSRSDAHSRAWIMPFLRSLTNEGSLTTVWFPAQFLKGNQLYNKVFLRNTADFEIWKLSWIWGLFWASHRFGTGRQRWRFNVCFEDSIQSSYE